MITVFDLSEELGVSSSTLRKWESFFAIHVRRNLKGNREYDEFTIDIFRKIKSLVTQGMTTKEVKNLLNQEGTSYTKQYNQNPKMEIFEEKEPPDQLILKTFTAQLDKAQNEIKQLVYENADLKGKVMFFELKAREHEKNLNMVLEAKQETIEILRGEKTKKETDLKESQKEMMILKEENVKLEAEIGQLIKENNKFKEKRGLFDFLLKKISIK